MRSKVTFFRVVLLSCLVSNLNQICNAQETVEVDKTNRQLKSPIAFDEPFNVVLKDKDGLIDKVHVIKVKRSDAKKYYSEREPIKNLQSDTVYSIKPERNGENAIFKFRPIEANVWIQLVVEKKIRGNAYTKLSELFAKLYCRHNSKPAYTSAQITNFDENLTEGIRSLSKDLNAYENFTFFLIPWKMNSGNVPISDEFEMFYLTNLNNHYDEIYRLKASSSKDKVTIARIKSLNELALSKSLPELNNLLEYYQLTKVSQINKSDIALGYHSTSSQSGSTRIKWFDFNNRIKNLKTSYTFLNSVQIELDTLKKAVGTPIDIDIKEALDEISEIKLLVYYNLNDLKYQSEIIQGKIDKNPNFRHHEIYNGNTDIKNLKVFGTRQLMPEIGACGIYTNSGGKNNWLFAPYFGASFYIKPINKDIPYKYFKNNLLRRISINGGILIGGIDSYNDEYKDLYNSISPMLGLNIKPTRGLAFSIGTVWLKRKDANPLIDEYNTTMNIYLGLSLDLDFANSISKLTSKAGY